MEKHFTVVKKLRELGDGLISAVRLKKTSEQMIDVTGDLEPVVLENTNRDYETDKAFTTVDYVFVRSLDDLKKIPVEERAMSATAYAIGNGISVLSDGTSPYYLRTAHSPHAVNFVSGNGVPYDTYVNDNKKGDWRGIHISLKIIKPNGVLPTGFGAVNAKKQTIEFGCWPQTLCENMEELDYLLKQGKMNDTSLWYHGALKNGKLIKNKMYKYNDEYYVRVQQGGENNRKTLWYQPKMIVWKILNWDEMPRCINPHGNGTARYIDASPEQLLDGGIPFYPEMFDENNSYYQNSTLRGVLNGINVNLIESNGNSKYGAKNGGNFIGKGFLQQAFVMPLGLLRNLTKTEEQYKAKNLKMQTRIRRAGETEVSM